MANLILDILSNLTETLHSSRKLKYKQLAKKQKFGTTIRFPEGLEDTPLNQQGYLEIDVAFLEHLNFFMPFFSSPFQLKRFFFSLFKYSHI